MTRPHANRATLAAHATIAISPYATDAPAVRDRPERQHEPLRRPPAGAARSLRASGRDDVSRYPWLYARRLQECARALRRRRARRRSSPAAAPTMSSTRDAARFAEPGEGSRSRTRRSDDPAVRAHERPRAVPVPLTRDARHRRRRAARRPARESSTSARRTTRRARSLARRASSACSTRARGLVILDEAYAEFAGGG